MTRLADTLTHDERMGRLAILARDPASFQINGEPQTPTEAEIIKGIDEWWDLHTLDEEEAALAGLIAIGEPESVPDVGRQPAWCRMVRRLRNRLQKRHDARKSGAS